jgi:hypothetical protein
MAAMRALLAEQDVCSCGIRSLNLNLSVHSEPSRCDRSEDSMRIPNFWKLPFFRATDNSCSSFRRLKGLVSWANSLAICSQVRSDI